MPIEMQQHDDHDIVIHHAEGALTSDQIQSEMEKFFETCPNKDAIWDFTNADMKAITREDMERLYGFLAANASKRDGGRTAFVAQNDLEFGLSRMAEMLTDSLPYERRTFRSIEEAIAWLADDALPPAEIEP